MVPMEFQVEQVIKAVSIHKVDAITTLAAQVEGIIKRLDAWQSPSQAPMMSYESWGHR